MIAAAQPAMRPTRTYGTLRRTRGGKWAIHAEPHVLMVGKRLWKKGGGAGSITLPDNPSTAIDLAWFLSRYPLDLSAADAEYLHATAAAQEERIRRVADYLGAHVPPPAFDLAIPPRDYQAREAAVLLEQGSLLVLDQVGLGKSVTAITAMSDSRTLPAVVVCMTHLPHQWAGMIRKFAPKLRAHVIKNGPVYPLAGAPAADGQLALAGSAPDVVILSYSKLAKWAPVLAEYARMVVFDEVQELRSGPGHKDRPIQKYAGAKAIAEASTYRLGLTATPIHNYGDELHNLIEILTPGALGSRWEFLAEWCVSVGTNNRYKVKNPAALGAFLREQGIAVRHTRQEVGRELPDAIVSVQEIGSEARALDAVADRAGELARLLVAKAPLERGEALFAGGELDRIVRQATGLAKAPYVAAFVRLLVESGEKVLLAGWHHAVYDVWQKELAGIETVRYTGQESTVQKETAARAFIDGDASVLMISLRSGVGLDGLQGASRVVVFGELDWSPAVHEQVVGRLRRDGQSDPVVVYYLVADSGADPTMAQVLNLKRQQSAGIVDPFGKEDQIFASGDEDRTRRLAEDWLSRGKKRTDDAE